MEPFPPAFERLAANYAPWRDRLALAQVAVTATRGVRPLFFLKDRFASYDELNTLDETLLQGHVARLGLAGAEIRSIDVRCVTLPDLCIEYGLERIDILLVDAEGQDGAILQSTELRRWSVQLVVFEHSQLSIVERADTRAHLERSGYDLLPLGGNTAGIPATLAGSDAPVARAWRLLKDRPVTGVEESPMISG